MEPGATQSFISNGYGSRQFEQYALATKVYAHQGATPYTWIGNWGIVTPLAIVAAGGDLFGGAAKSLAATVRTARDIVGSFFATCLAG